MSAPKQNRYAVKDDGKQDATLQMRCTQQEKQAWTLAAALQGKTLTAWIKDTLNNKPV
jgi:uncharacterized protein (DUF1778 family)